MSISDRACDQCGRIIPNVPDWANPVYCSIECGCYGKAISVVTPNVDMSKSVVSEGTPVFSEPSDNPVI